MTRASLGHTGRPLSAGPATKVIYGLITLATLLRILTPLAGDLTELMRWLAGAAWSCAFGLFAVFYGLVLVRPGSETKSQGRSKSWFQRRAALTFVGGACDSDAAIPRIEAIGRKAWSPCSIPTAVERSRSRRIPITRPCGPERC